MIEVVRYECEHCNKIFKTATRHKCKQNPELKNCFSCRYSVGWIEDYTQTDEYGRIEMYEPPCIDCLKFKESETSEHDINYIKSIKYNMQCPNYSQGSWVEDIVAENKLQEELNNNPF